MNNAQQYAERSASVIQMRDAVEIVEAFKGQLAWSSEERVLDIGCGPGTVTAQVILPILPPDATIIGSDISESMIKFANDEYGGARLKFKQMDIVSKDIWDKWNEETFNKIFSFYCLHWIQDQQLAVNNVYRLLKPGGTILVMFVVTNPVFNAYEIQGAMPKWKPYMQEMEKFLSPYHKCENASEKFANILAKANFVDIDCFQKKCSHLFKSLSPMMRSAEAVNPFIDKIPKELLEEYKSDLLRIFTEHKLVTLTDHGVRVDYVLMVATARKSNQTS